MEELDSFLEYLYESVNDPRAELKKELKYGVRNYMFNIYIENNNNFTSVNIFIDSISNFIEFSIDMDSVTIENEALSKKWANIYEKHLSDNLSSSINNIIQRLSKTSFLREYKLRKIL